VTAYELCAGRRPYEIHSHTPNKDIRHILKVGPEWPPAWPAEFTMLVQQVKYFLYSCLYFMSYTLAQSYKLTFPNNKLNSELCV